MAPREIGSLSLPPVSLSSQRLPIVTHSDALTRVHRVRVNPKFFGKTGLNRFDSPHGEFGILYTATDLHGAFIETFGDTRNRTVTVSALNERAFARMELSRALRLVDLTGAGLARIGADARLFAGEHVRAQQWSLAVWRHASAVDGLYYRARHDPSRFSVAVYNRASHVVTAVTQGSLMEATHRMTLARILDDYQFSLLEA